MWLLLLLLSSAYFASPLRIELEYHFIDKEKDIFLGKNNNRSILKTKSRNVGYISAVHGVSEFLAKKSAGEIFSQVSKTSTTKFKF